MASAMLIFDGDCSACQRLAGWGTARFRRPVQVMAFQAIADGETPGGLTTTALADAVGWVDEQGRGHLAEVAVAKALQACGGVLALLGWLILHPPLSWAAPGVYRLVARNRHRLPGGTAACELPRETTGDT
ncbi:MAG TPA: DCC1-like thiol-disulfide oxidoreductase family protein [Acidimicrobiales bacterium]|nr:DCC1-like thiol-disulfide oxidoreductase family protein [Acidimicrobiales bacterium]